MGLNFDVTTNEQELANAIAKYPQWYAQVLVDKSEEYRVFVAQGRVFAVAKKIPSAHEAIIWNVAQSGSVFKNVKWGEWRMDICELAIKAHLATGLDISGVDIIVERETNQPMVLELNSAPSFPFREDGEPSYRQRCLVRVIRYILDNNSKDVLPVASFSSWEEVIHPSVLIQ